MIGRTLVLAVLLGGCYHQVAFNPNASTNDASLRASEARFRICDLDDDGDDLHRQLKAAVCGSPPRGSSATQRDAEFKRVADLVVSLALPVGSVIAYAADGPAPAGFLDCDGSAVQIERYRPLFNLIRNRYGNGGGQPGFFSLPNYQGRFLRGVNGLLGVDPEAANRTAPWSGGEGGNVVGSVQDDALQTHTHHYKFGHGGNPNGDDPRRALPDPGDVRDISSSGPEAARTASETRPKNIYVRWLIKY